MLDFSRVKAERLSKIYDVSKFDCGDEDLNDFIKNDAFIYQEKKIATTILFFYEENLIGFVSIAADSLKLNFDEKQSYNIHQKKLEDVPAVKLARLAVNKIFQKQGIGTNILKWVITKQNLVEEQDCLLLRVHLKLYWVRFILMGKLKSFMIFWLSS